MSERREARYTEQLDTEVFLSARWTIEHGEVLDYGVPLFVESRAVAEIVCVFDNAHGEPGVHPFRKGEKQRARKLPPKASANFDLAAAIREIKASYGKLIEP